ncbi:MAG: hypothetical protein R3E42_11285 [Burkholderiaceae bacterium]
MEKNIGSMRLKSFSSFMRSIKTEPTMPRQPTKPTNLLISMPFQDIENGPDRTVLPQLVWPGRAHDEQELDQPLMVVVLMMEIARAATPAMAAGAVIKGGRAAYIGWRL